MKIAVVGAGAIGGFVGSLLWNAGQDVTLIEKIQKKVEIIGEKGLKIILSPEEEKIFRGKITSDPSSVGTMDLVIIAVKSFDTEKAIREAKPLIGENTYILSLQNGAGNVETIASVVGFEDRVLGGTFLDNVDVIDINVLRFMKVIGGINLGSITGKNTPRVHEIADIFRKAGIEVKIFDRIQDSIWSKVVINLNNAITAIPRVAIGEILDHPSLMELTKLTMREGAKVVLAKGLNLVGMDPKEPEVGTLEQLKKVKAAGIKNKASMLQDIEAGRKTEIDALNGMVVKEGKALNIPTPVNETLVLLVKTIEEIALKERRS